MRVRIARSIKQPVLHSYYISRFGEDTLDLFKKSKPFTAYHKDLKEYEITREVYKKIKEPVTQVIDERVAYTIYTRKTEGLYGYQEDAVNFARTKDNVLINFQQGMGKSLTTMKIIDDQKIQKTLLICGQSNLQEEWIKDAKKHRLKEKLNIRIIGEDTGASTSKKTRWLTAEKDVKGIDIINIEGLRNDGIVTAINEKGYDCIVVDEVQSAKGWKAKQTEGLHMIVRTEGQKRIALSGTPVLNNPLEFFSLLKFLGVLQDSVISTFRRYYGEWGFDRWGHFVCKGYRNIGDLVDLIKPILCSAEKNELNLPQKTRRKIDLEWENDSTYNDLLKVYNMSDSRMKKAGYKTKPQVRALMQFESSVAQEKTDFILEQAKQAKVLVFSQYTTVLEVHCQRLANQGLKVLYYHGKLNMKERLEVLEKWATKEYDVLLLSTMAARYGLNLTEATVVAFLDMPPNLAVLEQAEDRAHRIGQLFEVTSYLLCVSDIDQQAADNIEEKQLQLDELIDRLQQGIATYA